MSEILSYSTNYNIPSYQDGSETSGTTNAAQVNQIDASIKSQSMDIDTLWADIYSASGRVGDGLPRLAEPLQKTVANLGVYNVKAVAYGASGNGIANDDAAIQSAVDACYAAGGGIIFFPPGTYAINTVTKSWTAKKPIIFQGSGPYVTVFVQYASGNSALLDFSATDPEYGQYLAFRDFSIVGTAKGHHGLQLNQIARSSFENVYIEGCERGISNLGSLVLDYRNVRCHSNNIGLYCRKSGSVYSNAITIDGRCVFVSNTTAGIDFGEGAGLHISGADIESNGTAGNVATGGVIIRGTIAEESLVAHVTIDGETWFENNYGRALQIEAPASGQTFVSLRDITFQGTETISGRKNDVYVAGVSRLELSNIMGPTSGSYLTILAADSVKSNNVLFANYDIQTTSATVYPRTTSTTWNPGSLAQWAATDVSLGLTGVAIGDICKVSFTSINDLNASNFLIYAHVTAADTVTVFLLRVGSSAQDLPEGTLRVEVT